MTELTQYPAITAVCYLLGLGVKASPIPDKFIPLLCGVSGAALGVAAWVTMPAVADSWLSALALGVVSGLAATGADQAVKCLQEKA